MSVSPVNPKPFLTMLLGKTIMVKLKWGLDYRGELKSFDDYMNLQLVNSEEWVKNTFKGVLGEILLRCNNILYIRESPPEEQDVPMTQEQPPDAAPTQE